MIKCDCIITNGRSRFLVSLVSVPRIGEKIRKSPSVYMVTDVIYYAGVATVDLHVVETI